MDFLGIFRRTAQVALEGYGRDTAPRSGKKPAECTPCAANAWVSEQHKQIAQQMGSVSGGAKRKRR